MLPREPNLATLFSPSSYDEWRKLVDADLQGAPFERKLVTHTYEGLSLKPLYTAQDFDNSQDGSGFSGTVPYIRGSIPTGTSACRWDIRQEHADPEPNTLNLAILDDLTHGVTSVLLRLDLAARHSLDADDPAAAALAGLDGAMIYTAADLATAFDGVFLDMIGVALEPGSAFIPAAAQLAALWQSRGVPFDRARGAFNADPLAVLARDGHLPYPIDEGLRRAADLAAWTRRRFRNVTSLRVGTAPYHHAGCTATQDLAFSMATALEYLRAGARAGLSVDETAGQMVFSFGLGTQFFLAAAKLRAARRLWTRVVEAAGGSPDAARMRLHARPSRRVFTTRDPWVNILRNATAVFAAAVGGAESIGSVPFDAPLGPPSALGRRIARNTHLILQEESHLHRVNDPAGGSWYVESLTESLAQAAWPILQAIEREGGMARALASGWVAHQIDAARAPRAKNLATRKDAITGVSEFPDLAEDLPPRPAVDRTALRTYATHRLRTHRAGVDPADALRALGAANAPGELSEAAFAAAVAGASIGQIAGALGSAVGESLHAPLAVHPYAEAYEHLREASDQYQAACGVRPRVLLAALGPTADHLARVHFARGFFESGGFEAVTVDCGLDPARAAEALRDTGAHVAVLCSSDKLYPEHAGPAAAALHRAGARTVILAGNPGAHEAAYRAAGIDRFIFVKCDVVQILSELLTQEGVLA